MDSGLLALALIAGAVAAFNPCGFALLPAYLTVLVVQGPGDVTAPAGTTRGVTPAVKRAVRFAMGMTLGFVAVFGFFGLVITPLALSVERYLPIVTVIVGVALVGLGVWLLIGHSLAIPGLAGRGSAPTRRWASQIGYGASFALASLSCTIAPFLAVTTTALRVGNAANAMAAFIAYALGMGTIVLVLSLAVATASTSFTTRMRRAGPVISRFSGALLVLAGAYVTWYGWFEIRVLSGQATSDPVVSAALQVQGDVTRWVAGLGSTTLALVAVALAVTVSLVVFASWRRRAAQHRGDA